MIKFTRITEVTDGCREEFDYCWVWYDKFVCCDATYLNINTHRRSSALWNVRQYIYKLMTLNVNASSEDIYKDVMGIVKLRLDDGERTHILEEDVARIIGECFKEELPDNIRDIVYSYKKTEWKSDLRGLIVFDADQNKSLSGCESDKEFQKLKRRYISLIKQRYSLHCNRQVNSSKMLTDLISGITAIIDNPGSETDMSISHLSKLLGVDVRTIKSYRNDLEDALSALDEKFGLVEDKREAIREAVESKLIEGCYDIHDKGEKINKNRLHSVTKVSRPTIDKKWVDENFNLKEFVESLNK